MLTTENITRDLLRLIVWYPGRWIITLFPTQYSLALLRFFGDLHWLLSRGKRERVINNLKSIFPDKTADERYFLYISRQYFRNHYVNRLLIFLIPKLSRKNIKQFHTFEGIENLDKALLLKKGCILLHPHFGPLFLAIRALVLQEYNTAALVLTTDEGLSFVGRNVAYRLRVKYEQKIGAKMILANAFLRRLFESLHENAVLFTTGDGADDGKLIGKVMSGELFGRKFLFPKGAALIAKKTGSPILPIFTILNKDGTYKTIIHEAVNLYGTPNDDEVISAFLEKMEAYVLEYPYLWHFWDEIDKRILKDC